MHRNTYRIPILNIQKSTCPTASNYGTKTCSPAWERVYGGRYLLRWKIASGVLPFVWLEYGTSTYFAGRASKGATKKWPRRPRLLVFLPAQDHSRLSPTVFTEFAALHARAAGRELVRAGMSSSTTWMIQVGSRTFQRRDSTSLTIFRILTGTCVSEKCHYNTRNKYTDIY